MTHRERIVTALVVGFLPGVAILSCFWVSEIVILRIAARLLGFAALISGPLWAGWLARRILSIPRHVFPWLALHAGFWGGMLVVGNPKFPRPQLAVGPGEPSIGNILMVWGAISTGAALGVLIATMLSRKAGRAREEQVQ